MCGGGGRGLYMCCGEVVDVSMWLWFNNELFMIRILWNLLGVFFLRDFSSSFFFLMVIRRLFVLFSFVAFYEGRNMGKS